MAKAGGPVVTDSSGTATPCSVPAIPGAARAAKCRLILVPRPARVGMAVNVLREKRVDMRARCGIMTFAE